MMPKSQVGGMQLTISRMIRGELDNFEYLKMIGPLPNALKNCSFFSLNAQFYAHFHLIRLKLNKLHSLWNSPSPIAVLMGLLPR